MSDEELRDLALEVAQRASGFAARGSAIFNGNILAEELLTVAIKIRKMAKDPPIIVEQKALQQPPGA